MDASFRKRQKVASACERCRKRKLGCDAERPCTLCVRAGAQCIPRDGHAANYVVPASDHDNARTGNARTLGQQPGSPMLPESNIVDLSNLMIRNNRGTGKDLVRDTSSLPGGHKIIDSNTTLAGPRQRHNIAGVELPAEHVLEDLVNSFFSSVNWFMMVFHEDAFRRRFAEISRQEHVKYQDTPFYWTSLLVIALGAHYAALKAPEDNMSTEYRQLSKDILAVIETRFLQIVGCPAVESAQICILLGSFIFYTRPTVGLGICGMGVKIAQVISLHREKFWKETSELVREEKRRTWWALEVFDKYTAVAFGRPCIIDDSDCEVGMVTDIELGGHVHVPARPLILYHQHKFRLYRIMGAFLGRKRRHNVDSIDTIHQKMVQWRRDLPDVLTLGGHEQATSQKSVQPTQIHALSLQLTYDNLQIILHRTAVFRNDMVVGGEISATSPPGTSTSLQQIMTSALDTSELYRHPHILNACRKTHADLHIGITMFTAGVVLCAICLSQPLTDMGARAKTGVMHIIRMCRDTLSDQSSGQIISEQSLSIIDSLVEVMLRLETDLITGRTPYPSANASNSNKSTRVSNDASTSWPMSGSEEMAPVPSAARAQDRVRADRVLEPIQEVFVQHIPGMSSRPSTPIATDAYSAANLNDSQASSNLGTQDVVNSFNWDGDMSFLVDSGLVDASQVWLWADNLGYESFNNPAEEPPS